MLLHRLSSAPPRAKGSPTIEDLAERLDSIGALSSAGISINSANALRQSTVYSCVRILSEITASLHLGLFQKRGEKADEADVVTDHPALDVVRRPNNWMSWHELCQFLVTHSELRGNAYSFKSRSGDGRVRELLPLLPDQCSVLQEFDWTLSYTVGSGKEGVNGHFGPDRVFHLRNFGVLPYKGESTIALHRDSIGLALQMQRHSGNMYRNGANIGVVFSHPGTLSDEAYARLITEITKKYSGTENSGRPFIAEEGMAVDRVGMSMEDAQFIESLRFSKQEIAALFGVPMFLLNDTEKNTTWGTGLEQISRAFLQFSLEPRLDRICDTLDRELLLPKEQKDFFFKFDTSRFTMGDFATRMGGYRDAIASHVMTPNEARRREDMNPRDDGNEFPAVTPSPGSPTSDPAAKKPGEE